MSELNEMLEDLATLTDYVATKEAELKPYKEALLGIRTAVQGKMNELGQKSARTLAGHAVTISTSLSAKIEDGEAFFDWVEENGRIDMLERRVASAAVKTYLEEHGGEIPAGLRVETVNTLRFTPAKD